MHNCQEYDHTNTYCGYPSRCVCCSAFYQSTDCPNLRDAPLKYAFCYGDHPASFKVYSVYKDFQRHKKPVSSVFLCQIMLGLSHALYKIATQLIAHFLTLIALMPRLLRTNSLTNYYLQ